MEIKYEAVFGDQALFDNAPLGTELVGHSGGFYKNSPDGPIYCGGCTFTTDEYRNIGFIAARRIIKTPDVVSYSESKFEDELERLYWEFDGWRKKGELGERDVFKQKVRYLFNYFMQPQKSPVWTKADQDAGRLPEVGCEVLFNYYQSAIVRQGVIKYIDDQVVVIQTQDVTRPFCYETCKVEFTPLETPEERAKRVREEWVDDATFMTTYEIYDALLSGDLPVPGKE